MSDRLRGVALLREQSGDRMVEGWIEGPCAEGADLRGLGNLMLDFIDDGAFIRDLFAFVVEMETRFALAQIARGAELVGIGDAAASLVGPDIYQEFVLPCERQLVDRIHAMPARWCGCTSAATPARCSRTWEGSGARSSTSTPLRRSTKPAGRWDPNRCCSGTSTPCTS
jgi:uroporphyrinogen-III decarboxylase